MQSSYQIRETLRTKGKRSKQRKGGSNWRSHSIIGVARLPELLLRVGHFVTAPVSSPGCCLMQIRPSGHHIHKTHFENRPMLYCDCGIAHIHCKSSTPYISAAKQFHLL